MGRFGKVRVIGVGVNLKTASSDFDWGVKNKLRAYI